MRPIRLAILGSTNGSIVPALINQLSNLPVEVGLIISNKSSVGLVEKAQLLSLPYLIITANKRSREAYDQVLTETLKTHQIDLILLVGFMRILSSQFVNDWHDKILNVHPSLLPKHAGLMDLAVHQAAIDAGDQMSGCSVHIVTDQVDGGEILAQKSCSITARETATSLKEKVQTLEALAMAEAVKKWLDNFKEQNL